MEMLAYDLIAAVSRLVVAHGNIRLWSVGMINILGLRDHEMIRESAF